MHTPEVGPLQMDVLKSCGSIAHGFGLRNVPLENYLHMLEIEEPKIFNTNQIHGKKVHHLTQSVHSEILEGDAFMTATPGVVCFVRTADCVPILIADTKRPVIAAIHAGWRGTAHDVAGATIQEMHRCFGSNAVDLVAGIGPRVCGKCYEVGSEVISALEDLRIGNAWQDGVRHIDLGLANLLLLKRAGIKGDSISASNECTFCDMRFASWRRDRKERERQFSFIVIKDTEQSLKK